MTVEQSYCAGALRITYLLNHVLHSGRICSGNGDSEKGKHVQEKGNAIDNSEKQDLPDRDIGQVIKEISLTRNW
jgi:hypothetical protein